MFEYAVETPFPVAVPIGFACTVEGTETIEGTPRVVGRIDEDGDASLWTGYFLLHFAVAISEAELTEVVDELARTLNQWEDRPVPYAEDDSWQKVALIAADTIDFAVASTEDPIDLSGSSPLVDFLRAATAAAAAEQARADAVWAQYEADLFDAARKGELSA
jgi:hypothetical protein